MSKYIVVTGGVVSSIGKGITSASIGRILRSYGVNVTAIKIDPYLNWDSGTLNPYQHGEVYVTDDGMECDLDLGHYERFLDVELSGKANITTGKVYSSVIEKERKGEYLGSCVQIIPHITDEIKLMIRNVAEKTKAEVVMVEVGGTVGDIESQPFIEAVRQLKNEEGHDNCMFVHVTYVPYISGSEEYKSKPTQHSVKELQISGIRPDIIIARCDGTLPEDVKRKISLFCNVKSDCVIENTYFLSGIWGTNILTSTPDCAANIKAVCISVFNIKYGVSIYTYLFAWLIKLKCADKPKLTSSVGVSLNGWK